MENCIPSPLPAASARPIHVIVYHLPPPPPGCLYAFSTSGLPFPLQIMPPDAIAEPFIPLCQSPLPFGPYVQQRNYTIDNFSKLSANFESFEKCGSRIDNSDPIHPIQQYTTCNRASIPSAPACIESNDVLGSGSLDSNNSAQCINIPPNLCVAPSIEAIVPNPTSNAENGQVSNPGLSLEAPSGSTECLSEEIHQRDYTSADPKPSRFWCTKGTGFSRPQYPEDIADKPVITWGPNTSSSSQSGKTIDEVVAQNKRFNKTPSFRNKKFIRTSSRNGCLSETGRRVDIRPESSGSSCGTAAGMPIQYNPRMSKQGQHQITEYWRAREKPRELDGSSDLTQTSCKTEKACKPNQLEGMISLMHNFSFGLKNERNASLNQIAKDSPTYQNPSSHRDLALQT